MRPETELAVKRLIQRSIETLPPEAVAFRVFYSHAEYEFSYTVRTPEQLQRAGVSMRNLDGEWIKEAEAGK